MTNLNNLIKGTEFDRPRWRTSFASPRVACLTTQPRSGITPFTGIAWPQCGRRTDWRASRCDQCQVGSFDAFKDAFTKSAVGNFGSGWTWLVKKADGSLDIVNTSNAGHAADWCRQAPG